MLKPLDLVALALVIVGALSWALVGLFELDLIATLTGNELGETSFLSSVVYVLVGLAGVWLVSLFSRGTTAAREM